MHLVNNHRMATKWRKQKGRERRFFISFCCDFDNTKVAFPAAAGQSTESRVFFSPKKGILLFLEKKNRKMAGNRARFVVNVVKVCTLRLSFCKNLFTLRFTLRRETVE